jgi:hypothetical protein
MLACPNELLEPPGDSAEVVEILCSRAFRCERDGRYGHKGASDRTQ